MAIKVVHVYTRKHTVYIGRECHGYAGSKWANPFKIGIDGNRFEVIEMYETYVRERPDLMAALHELDGQILGCWCRPKACHGDVLRRLREEQLNAIRGETVPS